MIPSVTKTHINNIERLEASRISFLISRWVYNLQEYEDDIHDHNTEKATIMWVRKRSTTDRKADGIILTEKHPRGTQLLPQYQGNNCVEFRNISLGIHESRKSASL